MKIMRTPIRIRSRISIAFIAALGISWLLPISCQQKGLAEGDGLDAVERELTIFATQENTGDGTAGPATRTALVTGSAVHWLDADALAVFSAGKSARFVAKGSGESVPFSGTISLPAASASDRYIRAVYPYSEGVQLKDGAITTTLPSAQQGVEGSFANDLLIVAGRVMAPDITAETAAENSVTVPFAHVCSGIKFRLTREDIKKVKLTAKGGEALAGTFSFTWDDKGVIAVSSVSSPSSSVTVSAPSGETFKPGVWYYIVTLPVELSAGVTFTFTSTDNHTLKKVIRTPFSLNRGEFRSATDIDSGPEVVIPVSDNPDDYAVSVQVAGPDTWVATDELGRSAPTAITDGNVPSSRDNRKVLMFYSSWHTDHQVTYSPIVNVTGVKWFHPDAIENANHAAWGNSSDPARPQLCFWGEPLFGYYRTTDPWVLRKHAEMLADAGVDAVVFDCTNGEFLWLSAVKALLETWSEAKRDGVNVPKIAFMLQLSVQKVNERNALRMLYYGETDSSTYDNNSPLKGFYGRGEYSDLWFRLDGDTKPLIMAYPESLNLNDPSDRVIYDFFTWRPGQGDYVYGDSPDGLGNHQWGWLQDYPQNIFNNGEQMTVGVAQNASDASGGHCFAFNSPGSYGRSYTMAEGNSRLIEATKPGEIASFKYGYNFQEQWNRALDVDPHYVFITQWNEWVALKMQTWPPVGAAQGWFGYPNAPGYSFADQFDAERSRDIEPTANWGDHGDNYYYQLVENVRRYKGVGAYPNVSCPKTIAVDGDFAGWETVSPDFKHYGGNTMHRSHAGHSSLTYTNTTGRNDFVDARVTRDDEYVYFFVETREDITPRTDANWMRLLINIDRKWETGWKGYDFCLNYVSPASDSEGVVSRCNGPEWEWAEAGSFDYAVKGNKMEIRVQRAVLGINPEEKLDFEFKWCDNNLVTSQDSQVTRILNLYVDGDCAPGGRFNFHYKDLTD